MSLALQPCRPFHFFDVFFFGADNKLFFWYCGFWENTQLCLILNDSCLNDPFIHFTFSVAEDDHQWAAWPGQSQGKCLYSSERFAFLCFVVQTRFFITTSVSTGYISTTQKEFYETHHARIVTVPITKYRNCKWERDQTDDVNFVSKAGGVQWLHLSVLLFIRHAERAFKIGFIIKPF